MYISYINRGNCLNMNTKQAKQRFGIVGNNHLLERAIEELDEVDTNVEWVTEYDPIWNGPSEDLLPDDE